MDVRIFSGDLQRSQGRPPVQEVVCGQRVRRPSDPCSSAEHKITEGREGNENAPESTRRWEANVPVQNLVEDVLKI